MEKKNNVWTWLAGTLVIGLILYFLAWVGGAFEPTKDVTPSPSYDQQTQPIERATTSTSTEVR